MSFQNLNGELSHSFKEGRRNYNCYIKSMPENLLDVECEKCHALCKHILDLAQHFIEQPQSSLLLNTLWLYESISHKTFSKAWGAISRTSSLNVEPDMLSAIVDGNGETYTILFEDNKRYCSCIYGKSGKGFCYHQVAVLLAAILQKRLNTSEAKRLLKWA